MDYCEFFDKVTKAPKDPVKGLTVRDFLGARAHLAGCEKCLAKVDKVLADNPPPLFPKRGKN